MDEYNVVIYPTAQNDASTIVEHLNALPPEEAESYFDMLIKKAEVLKNAPSGCPMTKDSQLRLRAYRTLTTDEYVFFFVVTARTVEVRRILYAKRQYERLA
ncbi:MAG: type II toxin-antitoxin system RelE/ParE family toxin [Oscillospiraceae bacterium]|nr:type II toxin-antitoxin system RelE/ParE family toxin [Oscillospiraceae bacterium]